MSKKGSYVVEGSFPFLSEVKNDSIPYLLLAFRPDAAPEKRPLLFLLHPTGSTGQEYFELWEKEAIEKRVMLLAPELRAAYANDSGGMAKLYELLVHVTEKYSVDSERIFLIGTSAGALIAQWLMNQYPSLWRGAVLIAAPPRESFIQAAGSRKTPPFFWVHGEKDAQFSFAKVADLFQSIKEKGVPGILWSDPEAGHEHKKEWHPRIWEWLRQRGELSQPGQARTQKARPG